MMNILRLILTLSLAILPVVTHAHGGHVVADVAGHSHVLAVAAVLAAVAILGGLGIRQVRRRSSVRALHAAK